MINISKFISLLAPDFQETFLQLSNPARIQSYLDGIPYIAEVRDRSPLQVMVDGQAHCLDGGIFAALALARLGFHPLILDLVPEPGADDDHVLAIFQQNGSWGCIAKSNYAFLRFREPVYRNLRELSMTYFECYTCVDKKKTLRGYTRPLDLSLFNEDWMWDEDRISEITKHLYKRKPIALIDPKRGKDLALSDDRYYTANTLGTNFDWAFGIRSNS
jgi:hypothetical protein